MERRFSLTVTAIGEVRDADGHLVSTTPVEITHEVTAAELEALGLNTPTEENQ